MSDDPVRTHVRTPAGWRPFQEFMIVDGASAPIEGLELRGVEEAAPSPDALAAIAAADAIVIGPSNPIISIGPILALPGMREALAAATAPVVAVSPFVGGRAVKGPTDAFMAHSGLDVGAAGILAAYDGLLDGLVADERLPAAPVAVRTVDTLMDGAGGRGRLASDVLELASSLAAE
jgi:LPPG:FO 2-phospho-L-lactate transferase